MSGKKSVSKDNKRKENSSRRIPLGKRISDVFFIAAFISFAVIAVFVDCINLFGPDSSQGGITRNHTEKASWPPQVVYDWFHWWVESCDLVLKDNAIWAKALAAISPLLYFPFYLVAAAAFVYGYNWIRVPCIIWASWMILTLYIITAEQYWGMLPSPNITLYWAGYGPYMAVPFLVLYRMRKHNPFNSHKAKNQ